MLLASNRRCWATLMHLSTVVITETESTLTVEAVGPEATEVNIGLTELSVGDDQPGTEDRLGKNIEDGVGDDLAIDTNTAGTVSEAPDAAYVSSCSSLVVRENLHRVGGPKDEGVGSDGKEERGDVLSLSLDCSAAVDTKVPDDNEVGEAGNGVPSPLGRGTLRAESSEETSEDHDQVSDDGHGQVSTVHASEETKVEKQEGSGDGPVDVAGPEDLALNLVVGIRNVVVLLTDVNLVDGNTLADSHGEVGDRSGDGDQSRDDIEEALLLQGC
jgi:hypothetical protein